MKRTGVLDGNSDKNPWEVSRSCFVAASLRDTNSKTTDFLHEHTIPNFKFRSICHYCVTHEFKPVEFHVPTFSESSVFSSIAKRCLVFCARILCGTIELV